MIYSLWLLCSLVLPVLGLALATRNTEASEAVVYIVSYVEVMPSSQGEATALLRQYREASRQEAGNLRLEVLQQQDRPEHFALVEAWQDQSALEAHRSAAHTTHLHHHLQPLRLSPYDERLHQGLAHSAVAAGRTPGATYVVTHADAVPAGKDTALMLLQQVAEASRSEEGNVHFAVLQQQSRQNHCTIVEIWRDPQARDAHAMAAHTRQFREAFHPLSGSLYDERLYQALD
jgi:autoinducer 2-degrading protein